MTRVIHVISGLMYGGGQKVALDLLDGFTLRGADARLWLLGCRHDVLRERAEHVVRYDGAYSSPATLIAAARRVRALLAASAIDIVHSHGWDADTIAFLATLGRPEARVVHLHVTPTWIFSARPQHQARRLVTGAVFAGDRTRVLAVANAVRAHWARSFPTLAAGARVVYNAADTLRFCPTPTAPIINRDTLTLGVACRLAPQKGLGVLLHALASLSENTSTPIALKIAGEGPEREALSHIAHELKLDGVVQFLGHVDAVETFYRSLDVLVLPAVSDEGMPLTILEAMATGLPIVTSEIGGAKEVIRDGVDGLIVPPNEPEALAAALVELRDNPARRRQMGRNALLRVQSEFSPRAQVEAVAEIYAQLMQRQPRRRRPLLRAA